MFVEKKGMLVVLCVFCFWFYKEFFLNSILFLEVMYVYGSFVKVVFWWF